MSDEQEGDSYGREKKTTGIFGYPQMDGDSHGSNAPCDFRGIRYHSRRDESGAENRV